MDNKENYVRYIYKVFDLNEVGYTEDDKRWVIST